VFFAVYFLENCAEWVYVFVLFERREPPLAQASCVASIPGAVLNAPSSVQDRLVEIGQAFEGDVGILGRPACVRDRTLYDRGGRCCNQAG
jgi:hypothetical protein